MYDLNEEGLQFYDDVFDELLKYGIEPVVTLNHFDMPMHLADNYDGWLSREVIDSFLFFAKTVFNRYKDKIKYWMIFNEINPNNKIGMMVSYTPSYPMTCLPEDVMEAVEFNRQKHFYMDIQAKGYYPEYQLKFFERSGISIQIENGDLNIIKNGTVDYIEFSYYMSTVSSTDSNAEKQRGTSLLLVKIHI